MIKQLLSHRWSSQSKRSHVLAGACSVWALALLPSRAVGQSLPPKLVEFLRGTAGFTSQDLAAVESGNAVVKVLGDSDSREIALLGVIEVGAPRAVYVAQVTDSLAARRDPSRLGSGRFSDPAVPADVAALTLPHSDVQDLAHCRPGSCKLKLPASAIAHLRAAINPDSPSADSIANNYFARRMVDYVTAYRARGKEALVVYDDQAHPVASSQVWNGILSRSRYMYEYTPTLQRYLANYPENRPANVKDAFLWGTDDIPGAKPILAITHEVVYTPRELTGSTLVATQQLYADHYLDGALDLIAVIDRPIPAATQGGAQRPGVVVVFLRRFHFDELPSGGIVNIRGKVIGKSRARTEAFLRDSKKDSEEARR